MKISSLPVMLQSQMSDPALLHLRSERLERENRELSESVRQSEERLCELHEGVTRLHEEFRAEAEELQEEVAKLQEAAAEEARKRMEVESNLKKVERTKQVRRARGP